MNDFNFILTISEIITKNTHKNKSYKSYHNKL